MTATAAYISRCTARLLEQIEQSKGWPASFVFPGPANLKEQEAFGVFVAEVEKATGRQVRFHLYGGGGG